MDPKLEAAHQELTNRVMGRPGVTGTSGKVAENPA